MKLLASMLLGPSGKASTMRGATLFVVMAIVGTWALVSVQKQQLQQLDPELVYMVLGALGIKAYQRRGEGREPAPNGSPGPAGT